MSTIQGIGIVAFMLLLLITNFSFRTEKVFTIDTHGGLFGFYTYHVPETGERGSISEGKITFTGVDEVIIGGMPEYGGPIPAHPMTPTKKVRFDFHAKEFLREERLSVFPLGALRNKKRHEDYDLRIMAVSAPFFVSSAGNTKIYSLGSRTPFSLQNAVRLGAQDALLKKGAWAASNWSDRELLSDSVFLLNYQDEDMEYFVQKLDEVRPQVLFIGTMTLSFPGAIQLAKVAKEKFGDEVFIVLGGKHVNETIYLKENAVVHHVGSSVLLMQQGRIPKVFDLVVSGDGEEVVRAIGESIGNDILSGTTVKPFSEYASTFNSLRGNFILSWIENNAIESKVSEKIQLDYASLPSPVSLFGVTTRFEIFGREKTAHVYSDMGKGCVMNCSFCSERNAINGKVAFSGNPAERLYNQLRDACVYGNSMSAFVEDSILLTGKPELLNDLAELLEQKPLDIVFGGQFTIDNVLTPAIQQSIIRLSKVGLVYIYTGMETVNESVATLMSKNTHKNLGWMDRNIEAVRFLSGNGIKYGVSTLWGLGESQRDRLHQFALLKEWQDVHGNPVVVSVNWATQHPLFNVSSFDYIDWGTERTSPYLPLMVRLFGEASEKYTLTGVTLPSLVELEELERGFEKLKVQNA